MKLLPLVFSVLVFLLYLIYERISMSRQRNSIPLRISVTGTRGKSSVVRIIAAILREDGRKVIAKTTGSQARIVLPDAREIEVARRGVTSIIEQKKLLKKAAKLKADCLVAEIMSLHPENHYVESQQILQPHIVVITNVRQDHTEAMGETKEEIAAVLALDIPAAAKVFVLEKENRPLFETAVKNAGGELITVREGVASPLLQQAPELQRKEFPDNLDLVCALGKHLQIDQQAILNGIRQARHDIGKFKIWKYHSPETQKTYYLVNGFAANDPESTSQVIAKVKETLPSASDKLIGLLSLRADRGDRTKQWLESLSRGAFDGFSRIYVTGAHSKIFERKMNFRSSAFRHTKLLCLVTLKGLLQKCFRGKTKLPEAMMKTMLAEIEDQSVIFGFGNMKGTGELLVDYWNKIGAVYEL
jgi:poly-gamma-glutamate synthase PgsB/CapB